MTDLDYRNRTISSLVQELNHLGNRSVLVHPTQSIAIQAHQNNFVKRFQTKSVPKKQFFKCHDHDKKYFYTQVHPKLDSTIFTQFMANWQKGYNCTILLQNDRHNLTEILKSIQSWTKGSLVFCIVLNNKNQLQDLLGQTQLTHRQLLQNKKYYEIEDSTKINTILEYLNQADKNNSNQPLSTFIDITFKNPESCSQLHLTLLPSEMFSTECDPPYSLIKTQLIQLLNYIKMNPSKRYEHISKLITKRLPMTNFLTKILMSDSCNLLLNFINPQHRDIISKFQLFDKLSIIENLLRKPDRHVIELGVVKPLPKVFNQQEQNNDHQNPLKLTRTRQQKQKTSQSLKDDIVSPIGRLNLKTQHEYDLEVTQKQRALQQKQFDFCRSLERKTHKFSISPRQNNSNTQSLQKKENKNIVVSQVQNFLDKKTISKYDGLVYQGQFNNIQLSKRLAEKTLSNAKEWNDRPLEKIAICESEQIALLKAQHAREVSQYHQTIQLLNKKIIVLTKQNHLEELYKIHERQIMLLELKIKELREDIAVLTKDQPNEKAIKSIVKRLTEQVKSYETTSTSKKLSQGRMFMLQKQIKQVKQKLGLSEKARASLTLQVQTLTKRLKIRDSEIQKINQEDIEKYQCEDLSLTEEQILEDIKKLVKGVKEQQRNSGQFLLRKISLILSDLSKSRDIILECNDFLVQLMQILDERLNKKAPEIVLDCNKFIRGFLMENLSIF